MKRHLCLGSLAMLWILAAVAAEPAANVSIPFANYDGIRDWSADGTKGIYIQARNGQWYHAALMAQCIDLPFSEHVGFVTTPGSGTFDRFSSIIVRGHKCPVMTLAPSDPPRAKTKHSRDSHSPVSAPDSGAGAPNTQSKP